MLRAERVQCEGEIETGTDRCSVEDRVNTMQSVWQPFRLKAMRARCRSLRTEVISVQLQHAFKGVAKQTNPLVIRIDVKAGHGAGKPTNKVSQASPPKLADEYSVAVSVIRIGTWKPHPQPFCGAPVVESHNR